MCKYCRRDHDAPTHLTGYGEFYLKPIHRQALDWHCSDRMPWAEAADVFYFMFGFYPEHDGQFTPPICVEL